MAMTPEKREGLNAAKARIAEILQDRGENVNGWDSVALLSLMCRRNFAFGARAYNESTTDYFNRVAERAETHEAPKPKMRKYRGEIVQPFTPDLMKRTAYVMQIPDSPRAAMMDDLPHPISMPWDGTGVPFRLHANI